MQNFTLYKQTNNDITTVEVICDLVFGKNRFQKSSYLLRENTEPVYDLCYVAVYNNKIIATIRYWEISLESQQSKALLLGPIAVLPVYQNLGFARALIEHTIAIAKDMGYEIVLLVGDISYYQKCQFKQVPIGYMTMLGAYNPERLCYRLLCDKDITTFKGNIRKYDSQIWQKTKDKALVF